MPVWVQAKKNAILTCAVLAACFLLTACRVEILHDLSEPEANTIMAALQTEGIFAQKERLSEGSKASYTIAVRRSDAPQAWQILNNKNLPRSREDGLGEVFGDVGLVPTNTQERALMRHALAGEIARTLNVLDGVRQARVHIVLPRRDTFAAPDAKPAEPRAAVLLKVDGSPSISLDQVRKIVAGSVDGLDPKSVNVVISQAQASQPSAATTSAILASMGPFQVAAGSRSGLVILLIVIIAMVVGLTLTALFFWRRNRLLAEQLAQARRNPPPRNTPHLDSSLSLIERSITQRPHRTQ